MNFCLVYCCEYNTLNEYPNGTYEICKICFWEHDEYQTKNPEEICDPNNIFSIKARKNFEEFGACEKSMIKNVRKPNKFDIRKL